MGLVDSIKQQGLLTAISVRERQDPDTGEKYYELIDGLHRFSACKDAVLETIDVIVKDFDDDQVLEAQIMANLHKIETRPVEYSKQLRRIMARNPLMTESELAHKLGKSGQWVRERLGLNKITNENIASLIDEGKIGLASAYALAKLPEDEMADYIDRAMTLPVEEFVPLVNKRVKEIKEERRKGRDASPQEFQPVAHMQKMRAVKDELENAAVAKRLIATTETTNPVDAFILGLKWVLHLDPESIIVQKERDEKRKAEREEAKKKRADEREAKKSEEEKEAAAAAEEAKEILSGA